MCEIRKEHDNHELNEQELKQVNGGGPWGEGPTYTFKCPVCETPRAVSAHDLATFTSLHCANGHDPSTNDWISHNSSAYY